MRKPKKEQLDKFTMMARRVSITLVVICVVLVVLNLLSWMVFRDDVVAKRKMEAMARDYYENYYYEKNDRARLAKYAENGLPDVSLRVLLTYDSAKNADEEYYFKKTACDAGRTVVVFYPEEPLDSVITGWK